MEPSTNVSTESIDPINQKSVNRVKKHKKQLYADLKKQIEFYLSDANLRKDRYFGNLMQTSQCVSVETFLNCNKIKNLTINPEDIVKALEDSDVLTVSDCKTKIYRLKPIEDKTPEDIDRCTVYVEQLPPKADHDWVKSMFEKYGSVAYVSLPKFKSGTIKRFAFVEFDDEKSAQKILEEYKKLHEESKILPEELQSIITFKEDGDMEEDKSNDNVNSIKKRKHSISTEGVKEKKIKKETHKISPIGNKNKKKKNKHKKDDVDGDQKNSSYEINDNESNQKDFLNDNVDSSIVKSKNISPNNKIKKVNNIQLNDAIDNDQILNKNINTSIVKKKNLLSSDKSKKDKNFHINDYSNNKQNNYSNEICGSESNQKISMVNENVNSNIVKSEENTSNDIKKESNIVKSEENTLNDIEKESNIDFDHMNSVLKKKRKRNKGKKIKSDTTSPGLRVISKIEWKKLRNQFLNMQRQKMSLLKAHLRHPRYNTNYSNTNFHTSSEKNIDSTTNNEHNEMKNQKVEDVRVKYEPGVILKVSFTKPIESDKIFKAEARTDSSVKFVDVINNLEAYVRCDCPESAKIIAEENRWPHTSQLDGEEEKLYWQKILHDREIKCTKQKETKKLRGRTKLINKAEKTLAQHVKFLQDDESI